MIKIEPNEIKCTVGPVYTKIGPESSKKRPLEQNTGSEGSKRRKGPNYMFLLVCATPVIQMHPKSTCPDF